MKFGKRLGAWLLTAALTLSLLPVPAVLAAEEETPQPIQEEPQPIQEEQTAPAAPAVVKTGNVWKLTDDGTLSVDGIKMVYRSHSENNEIRERTLRVVLADSMTSIGKDSFYAFSNLVSIEMGENVEEIGEGAFTGCSMLSSINLPQGLTSIGAGAFRSCGRLRSMDIPSGVTSIQRVFPNCENLQSVSLPSALTNMEGAFQNCTSLQQVSVPASVRRMRETFSGCTSLTEVNIPAGVTDLTNTFADCTALKQMDVPDGVISLEGTFSGCTNLETVTLPASVANLVNTFSDCTKLKDIYYAGTQAQWLTLDAKVKPETVIHTSDGDIVTVAFDTNLSEIYHALPVKTPDDQAVACTKPYGTLPTYAALAGGTNGFDDLTFLGWYTAPSGGEQVTAETLVSANGLHTLYAHWQANWVYVTFDELFEDRYNSPVVRRIRNGEVYGELPENSKAGYTFDGWYTAAEGGTKLESTSQVSIPAGKQLVSGREEQTVYAHWTGNLHTVTFDPQGGTVTEKSRSVHFGDAYGPLPVPTRVGYTFDGWALNPNGYDRVTAETKMTSTYNYDKDHTLYAQWLGDAVTVTLDPQGGSVSKTSLELRCGGNYASLPTPKRDNFTFEGWYTAPTGGSKVDYSTKVERSDDHTIYAHWKGKGMTVNLDAQGGSVYTSRLEVVNGQPYGELPVPTRTGYDFEGWYTSPTGGTQVTGSTTVALSKSQTLYARWKGKEVTVTLDARGGTASVASKRVRYGEVYGTLPMPTRADYEFMGWYTDFVGGTRVTETTTMNQKTNHTLYARWQGKAYTVTLDPQGGTMYGSRSGSVRRGEPYGSLLVTPTREGYDFLGWYTAATGGTSVNAQTIMGRDQDHTLYAQWKEQKHSTLEMLSYKYSNSTSGFGYPSNYRIPYARFALIFGHTALARSYYNSNGYWGGNCFGMSSTAGMFFQEGNGVDTTDFNKNATRPYDLTWNDKNFNWDVTPRDFIEAMQISQKDSLIQQDYRNNRNKMDALARAVTSFQNTGKDPVVVAIFSGLSGHAIVGYEIEEVSAGESRMTVYDCNYPNRAQYLTLTKNASGSYTGWRYDPLGWGSERGGWISYVPYSHYYQIWQNREAPRRTNMNLLRVNSASATVYDSKGNVAAIIEDGEVTTNRADVYPMIMVDVTAEGTNGETKGTELWLPAELYTVTNDTGDQSFEATLVNVDQYASVTTNSPRVTLAVNDALEINYVQLPEAGSSYTISLNSSLEKGYADVQLTGTTTEDTLAFAQVSGALYAQGTQMQGGALKIDGADAAATTLSADIPDVNAMLEAEKVITFTDVAPNVWYADAVRYVAARRLFSGTSETTFSPDTPTSRAMLMTVLARYAGVDTSGGSVWYEKGMNWAKEHQISDGTNPNGNVTREQLAAMLYRYAESPATAATDGLSAFSDKDAISSWAKDAMAWAVANGIIKGSDGKLNPQNNASRAEVATMLMRFCQMREGR